MTIQINYKNMGSKKDSINLILFVDENFNINNLKKDLLFFEVNSKKTVFLVSIKKDIKISDIENLGAKFHSYINYDKKNEYFINSDTINNKIKNFVGYFLHGLKLKSYEFNIYKFKKIRILFL